tara:strand:+ start:854 stop:1009 length:156 start_codon:yes stop_codon:yes gene_type:complete
MDDHKFLLPLSVFLAIPLLSLNNDKMKGIGMIDEEHLDVSEYFLCFNNFIK